MKMTVEHRGGGRLVLDIRGHEVLVDQPEDADGSDTGPTPEELFVGGLAACVAYFGELYLRRHGLLRDDFHVECSFVMATDRPSRVASIELRVPVPAALDASHHEQLQRVLEHCAVHNSMRLPPDVRITVVEPSAAAPR